MAVVLGLAGVVAGFGVARLGMDAYRSTTEGEQAAERVDAYLHGAGDKEFFAADSQFRATFPSIPERSVAQTTVNGFDIEMTVFASGRAADSFVVGTFVAPPDALFDLTLSVNSVAAGLGGNVETAAPTTWQGYDAIEAVVSAPGRVVVQMLIVRTPQRVYIVELIGSGRRTAEYDAFKASFAITR